MQELQTNTREIQEFTEIQPKRILATEEKICKIESIINTISHRNMNEPIILDTNIITGTNFLNDTYNCKNFAGLSKENLEDTINSLEFTLKILEENNCLVVENVLNEINDFMEIMSRNTKYYNKRDISFKKNHIKAKDLSLKKDLLNKLCELSINISQKSKHLRYKPNTEQYKDLFDIICDLTKRLELKKEKYKELIPREYREEKMVYPADEEIVASALYNSLIEGRNCSIISMDPDVYNILKVCTIFLKSKYSGNPDSKLLLEKNIIRLYYPVSDRVDAKSAEPTFSSDLASCYFKQKYIERLFRQNGNN